MNDSIYDSKEYAALSFAVDIYKQIGGVNVNEVIQAATQFRDFLNKAQQSDNQKETE